jgi:hypothetical protein
VRLAGDALGEGRHKAGLANARLARDQHDLPFAPPGEALAFQQDIYFFLATDESSQTRFVGRLKATFGREDALNHPRHDWLDNALDLVPAEVAQTE